MEKTTKILIAGTIFIVLAAGVFGGWLKTAADTTNGKVPKASTADKTSSTVVSPTAAEPLDQLASTRKETTTQPNKTTTTMPEKPREAEPVDQAYKLEGNKYLEYKGYKFRLEEINETVNPEPFIWIDVVKPGGTEESHMADNNSNAMVDWIMIRFTGEYSKAENWAKIKFMEYKASLKLNKKDFQEYKGYKFRLNKFMYKDKKLFAILMDVVKPDGMEIELQTDNLAAGEWAVGVVDAIEIEFHGEYSENPDWANVKIRENK
jgi:hypothetical protein